MDEDYDKKASALRPFYFNVVVWGGRFRGYFLNLCLPTLLAPNNIPALHNRNKNKFLICTTLDDWDAMLSSPMFELLQEYVDPVFIRIPVPHERGLGYQHIHMGVGHKLATDMMYRDQAYGVILTPDCLLSDGSIAALERHAVAGDHVVLSAALRFAEEPLLGHLATPEGFEGVDASIEPGQPLSLSARQLVAAGLKSMHSETLRYEWDKPYFADTPSACWWAVPNGEGIVIHSLSWAPLLLDYNAISNHNTTALERWTMDGDYVYNNFSDSFRIAVIEDSDEIMHVSWAPLEDRRQQLVAERLKAMSVFGDWVKGASLRDTVLGPTCDPLKRRIFCHPVRWHTNDLNVNDGWADVERRAAATIRKYFRDQELQGIAQVTEDAHDSTCRGMTTLIMIWLRRLPVALLYRLTGVFGMLRSTRTTS